MKPIIEHSWDLSEADALALQLSLKNNVVRGDQFDKDFKTVAGVDIHYHKDESITAGIAVLNYTTLEVIEEATATGVSSFPYIPGLFSFRELPLIIEAMETLNTLPQIIVCDGQGLAHPRRFGLACHLGVLFDIPTIGCGKSRYIGDYHPPGANRGDRTPLLDNDEIIGTVLRTQTGINPLFISIGHRISLDSACNIALKLCSRYRLPETTRAADHLARGLA